MDKTLREMCETLNVTRRAVQGYEKANLITPSGRTKNGYLLYDAKTQERVRMIRFYQELGFSIKEIVHVIDAPNEIIKEQIEKKIPELKKKIRRLEELITRAYEVMEKQ